MTRIATHDELLTEYGKVLASWTSAIRAELPALLQWWEEQKARLAARHPDMIHIHWPAGFISHPRMVAIYRMHFFAIHELNRTASDYEHSPPEREEDEGWGSKAEQADADGLAPTPIPPNVLLIDELPEYAPDLVEHLRRFVFLPIGQDLSLELC